jgi:hypothetical protein
LFELNFNVQLQDPPNHVIEKIAAALHGLTPVELTQQAQLPLSDTFVHEAGTE